jgi:predicted secreted acid phosphatase
LKKAFALLAGVFTLAAAASPRPSLAMPYDQLEKFVGNLGDDLHEQTLTPISQALAFTHSKKYADDFKVAVADGYKAVDKAVADAQTRAKSVKGDNNAYSDKSAGLGLAVVSDLDETLIDNRPFFEKCADIDAGKIDWAEFEKWQLTCKAKPLKETQDLLVYARSKGVAVFFVTGRMERLRRATIENLVGNGIAYDGLFMRANGDEQSASTMKSAYRKQIEDMGFKVVVNIGDQYSDLSGGHCLDCEKLPNKIYFIR